MPGGSQGSVGGSSVRGWQGPAPCRTRPVPAFSNGPSPSAAMVAAGGSLGKEGQNTARQQGVRGEV